MHKQRARRTVRGAALHALLGALLFAAEAPPGHAQCDPAIQFVSDRTQFPTRAGHAVAFSGTTLGLIKIEPVKGPLYFALYDLDLHQISPDVKIADAFEPGTADLFWTGTGFGFFYEIGSQLVFQAISAAGAPIGGPVAMPLRTGLTPRDYDVTFDRVRRVYVIVHSVRSGADTGVWMTFISPAGAKTREELLSQFVVSFDPDVRVAVTGQGTIGVLYRNSSDELFRLVTVTAANSTRSETRLMTTHRAPFIAANDNEFALVFRVPTTSGADLMWLRLDSSGGVVLPETLLIAGNVDVAPVDFLWNPELEEWALAYIASVDTMDPGEYRLRRFMDDGTTVDDSIFAPDPQRKMFLGRNSFVFAGSGYISPVDFPLAPGVTESYLIRYCPFAVIADIDRRNVNVGGAVGFSARASGGTAGYTFKWDFGDGGKQDGQFVQHVFAARGVYTVTVSATDANGVTVTDTEQISVLVPKRRAVRK